MPDPLSKRKIRNVMRGEQKSTGITKINPGFYRALTQYMARLEEAYLEAHAQNKTQKALTLTKEIRDTERDISTIYELRERKILYIAQDIVRGGTPSLKYLIPEEKLLLLRLSSILLETRKSTKIDFHYHVDNFIRTIAEECKLEQQIFAPFHPYPPSYEEKLEEPLQGSEPTPGPTSRIPMVGPAGKSAGEEEIQDEGLHGSKSQLINEKAEMVNGTAPFPGKEMEDLEPAKEENGVSIEEKAVEKKEESIEEEAVEDEEKPESQNFLKEYAVAGTLGSIPQFRASDLHDYKFESGEIITLPLKMAKLLKNQGKIFIIEIGKGNGKN